MTLLPSLSSWLRLNKQEDEDMRVHLDDPLAISKLSARLALLLRNSHKKKSPVIVCIGTDRSTGDSLGPFTGRRLETLFEGTPLSVYGTIENPVHAQNLEAVIVPLSSKYSAHPFIAIDACLGQFSSVGSILLKTGPLQPGTGLGKKLPPVGDVSISGIVNVSGGKDIQLLQSTRLNLVLKMSRLIAESIYLGVQKSLART